MTGRNLLLAVFLATAAGSFAQQQATVVADEAPADSAEAMPAPLRIGYLSYDSALVSMPDYALCMEQLRQLREAYRQEMERVEKEVNDKYEDFLDGISDYPRTILLKRQNELQELLQRNVDFKNQSRDELRRAEADSLAPLRQRVGQAIAEVAREKGLKLVVNTDAGACPFIDEAISEDILEAVRKRLEGDEQK